MQLNKTSLKLSCVTRDAYSYITINILVGKMMI